ncbi:MAG: sugar-binding transcriptional regulator [Actinomycetales bacterium]
MPAPRAHSVLVAAARMHYLDGKSQSEIAKALDLSRSSVSRILAQARERGIVEIRIHPERDINRRPDLEQTLATLTGVEALVAARPTGRTSIAVVAELAARRVEDELPTLSSLGLSWGQTVAALVDEILLDSVFPHLHVHALVGGMPTTGPAGNDAIELLAVKGGFHVHRFEAPAVVESKVTWQALMGESSIQRTIAEAGAVQAAVVGIGSTGVHASPRVVEAMRLNPAERAEFDAQEPVGDLAGRYYDLSGTAVGPPTSERVVGISLAQLRSIPRVMGIAGGREKAPGVVGALRTQALGTVVLDEELAADVVCLLRGE